ncbi:glutathione peroxidase [Candidatus Izimaplasma bacterium ZiA1]|uniref:glutathione peroxidase n=1 Tax=Candidatus Izimoplasma sp. ZiA1 TaxID=2024899 RepID=UPI000BAA4EF9|nr:glutathione peroxidase [Candidatus Izimaplasma bacterium ZiA1]
MNEIYKIKVNNHLNEEVELSKYEGKVMLIVNTASKCGFTPQYDELEELYKMYNKQGLEILAFPCNQFGKQEAGSNEEIQSFCKLNFGLTFPVYAKIEVNGTNTHPLYVHLKNEKKGMLGKSIKWNFTKFLVDKSGNVVKRYSPNTKPMELVEDIKKYL